MYILASFVEDKVSVGAWIYLWAFYFVPLIYISVFVPVPYCLDNFCTSKETISKVKRQPSEWEKIIANEATDKQLIWFWKFVSFFFSWSVLLIFVHLKNISRESTFSLVDFSIVFLFSISLLCTQIEVVSFLLLYLDFICSSFSVFSRQKLGLLFQDLSSFLINDFKAIDFLLVTVSAASHKLICCVFIFSQF